MEALTIDGTPIPLTDQNTEVVERAGAIVPMFAGNDRNEIRWERTVRRSRTSLLTNAEANAIKLLCAGGRVVTCAGSIIDASGGSLSCRVLVLDSSSVTAGTDDGTNTLRSLSLTIRPVEPDPAA